MPPKNTVINEYPETAFVGFGGFGLNTLKYFKNLMNTGDSSARLFLISKDATKIDSAPIFRSSDMDKLFADAGDVRMFVLYGGLGGETIELMSQFCAKSRAKGIYTVAIVVYPFKFENLTDKPDSAIQALAKSVDAAIIFQNDNLPKENNGRITLATPLNTVAQDIYDCSRAIASSENNRVAIDIADLRSCLKGLLSAGVGHSKESLRDATNQAVAELKNSLPGASGNHGLFWSFDIPVNMITANDMEVSSRLIADSFPQFDKRLFKVIESADATEATAVILA